MGATVTKYLYTRDHLGSIREVLNTAGVVVAAYDYDPYGRRSANAVAGATVEADLGFTGHYHHAATGLIYAPYRAYDPESGRWISRDPMKEKGGMNLYAYVGGNPVNGYDTLGLWAYFQPTTWFDGKGYQPGVNEDDIGQAAQATLDGIIPFGDPFVNNGGYDPCDKDLEFSRKAGAFVREIYTGRLASGAFASGSKSLFYTGKNGLGWVDAVAGRTGAVLLDNTLGGRAFTALGSGLTKLLGEKVASTLMKPLWAAASANYAANAKGAATLVQGPVSPGWIWSYVERPILWARGLW